MEKWFLKYKSSESRPIDKQDLMKQETLSPEQAQDQNFFDFSFELEFCLSVSLRKLLERFPMKYKNRFLAWSAPVRIH